MSTTIKSGSGATLANVDTATNALQVIQKGVSKTKFTHDDFTLDSFERLRVSEPRIKFENTFGAILPSAQTSTWEVGTLASGSIALTNQLYGTNLTTTTANGSGYFINSIAPIRYAPGISTVFRGTFNFNVLQSGSRMRIGMFTDQGTWPSVSGDGLYLEAD